jgi:hypothetical protein
LKLETLKKSLHFAFLFSSLILLFRRNLASDKRQYNILSGRGQERKFIRRGFGVLEPFLSATP